MTTSEPTRVEWSVLIVIIIGTFMAILNGSIVNVALPKIMLIFNASTDSIQWVLTCYLMTLGITMPVTGYLAENFGYRRMYFIALALFTLGSALCGLSWSVESLIAARIIQAVGGGIMQPLGMAFMYRVTPRSQIGMVLGIWGIAAMAAPAIGPTLGGYLVEYVNWRLIFYLNVPIGIINLFLVRFLMKETLLLRGQQFDTFGFISSALGLFAILLGISQGTKHGWTSPYIVGLFSFGFIVLTAFVINELNHPEPLLDLRIFKNWMFTISTVIGSVINMGLFGAMFLLPMLLQNVFGQTAMKTGIILFPAAIATAISMPVSGRIFDKYGARGVVITGLGIVTFTTWIMGSFNELTAFGVMSAWLVLRGFGMGLCMMTVTTAGMNTVPNHLVSRASALGNVIRQVAASLGVAMFTSIMQHRQAIHLANLVNSVNFNSGDAFSLDAFVQSTAVSLGLTATNAAAIRYTVIYKVIAKLALTEAIDDCFLIAAGFCVIALVLSIFLRDTTKRVTPGELAEESSS